MDTEILKKSSSTFPYKKEDVFELSRNLLWQSIVALTSSPEFTPTIDWVSKKLSWASLDEIRNALDALAASSFLKQNEAGKYVEIDINLNDYFSVEEQIESDFLYSNQVSSMVSTEYLSTKLTRIELVDRELYLDLARGMEKLMNDFKEKSKKVDPAKRNVLAAIAVSITNVIREGTRMQGGQA